jgi:lysophospholipase L1-like esterase
MSARLPRRRGGYVGGVPEGPSTAQRGGLLAIVLVATVAVAATLAACRTTAATGPYVALGDSYSSGVGAARYSSRSGVCLRSPQSYVHRLGRAVTSFRACGGASTADVLHHQLAQFPRDTGLVTITIGGNDAGFADVLDACLFGGPAACNRRVDRGERFVRRELPARLRRVYEAIRARASRATVIVAGYPRLFARRPWCGRVGRIDAGERRRLNEASNLLARAIRAEVGRHRGFRFADVRPAFNGHGVCSRAPRIHGVTHPTFASFHPNVRGYATYARVIRRRL